MAVGIFKKFDISNSYREDIELMQRPSSGTLYRKVAERRGILPSFLPTLDKINFSAYSAAVSA